MKQDEYHVALPRLMGQPAYARPPRPVDVDARPLDPDDLPLLVDMTEEERQLAAQFARYGDDGDATGGGDGNGSRPFRLKALVGRLLGG